MINADRQLAERCDYPLHLGVTEAGPAFQCTVKSAVAFGALLAERGAERYELHTRHLNHQLPRVLRTLGTLVHLVEADRVEHPGQLVVEVPRVQLVPFRAALGQQRGEVEALAPS